MITTFSSGIQGVFRLSIITFFTLYAAQVSAQNCTLPNNSGQCSGGQGQIGVGGANITNGDNYWSTINRTVTGTTKVNNGGRLTVCSGILTLNDLDLGGGSVVVLQGATLNVQNANTYTGSSEIYNYGTINFNNNITLQGDDTRIYNHNTGIINVASPFQLLISNNAQLINANVVNVHTLNLNVNNPNPNAVCMGVNSVLLATNVIDQTSNNNGIAGLTNSCVSVGNSFSVNNTSPTTALLVCVDENASGTGSFGQATPTNQCTSCGILQSNALTLSLSGNFSTRCNGQSVNLTAAAAFLPFGMRFQWGTGSVGSNIISGATSSTLIVTPNQNTTYWVRLVEIANPNNVSTSSASFSVTVTSPTVSIALANTDMVWNGLVSNNWNNLSNWLISNNGLLSIATALPTTTQNVVIPASNQTCVVNNANIAGGTRNTKNLVIENNASLTMAGGTLRIEGNFTNNGTFTPGMNTVEFRDGATQTINMIPTSNTFYNFTVNKTGGEVILGSNIQVNNNLTMTARNLNLNDFSINLGTTGKIINEGESHRVYCNCNAGFIQSTATIGSNVTVQPGTLGITLKTNANPMGTTSIKRRHIQAGANAITGLGANEALGIKRVFDVEPQFNGSDYNNNLDVDITINFLTIEAQDIPSNQDISVYRSANQGSTWDNVSFESFTANSVTMIGLLGFSWVTAGPDDGNYLPIELIFFKATQQGNGVNLSWATASEQNNDYFTVERSCDGLIWEQVLTQNGAGTSIHRLDYWANDFRPIHGLSYYRLKQTDYDGQFSTSNIVSVVIDSEEKHFLYAANTLGQTVDVYTKGLVILVFSNGETQKLINE